MAQSSEFIRHRSCSLPKDVSECASNPCQNGGTCVEGLNQYKCTCPQNWSGSHCQHQTQTGQDRLMQTTTSSPFCPLIKIMSQNPLQHHPNGASWTTRPSAADLAVPRWIRPNTAAAMRDSTWAAPRKTASVKARLRQWLTSAWLAVTAS